VLFLTSVLQVPTAPVLDKIDWASHIDTMLSMCMAIDTVSIFAVKLDSLQQLYASRIRAINARLAHLKREGPFAG
jgi:hypothetical protein